MHAFIDPRLASHPPGKRPPARTTPDPEAIRGLHQLCRGGRLYDVERWIQDGRPIQALSYKRPRKPAVVSPILAAIRRGHRDLVLLLLCNGYRLDLEANDGTSVLDEALTIRAFDILDPNIVFGIPTRVCH